MIRVELHGPEGDFITDWALGYTPKLVGECHSAKDPSYLAVHREGMITKIPLIPGPHAENVPVALAHYSRTMGVSPTSPAPAAVVMERLATRLDGQAERQVRMVLDMSERLGMVSMETDRASEIQARIMLVNMLRCEAAGMRSGTIASYPLDGRYEYEAPATPQ